MPNRIRTVRTVVTAGNWPRPVEARSLKRTTRTVLRRQWAALAAPRA